MTTEQKNIEVAEKLGMCWHEWDWRETSYRCTKCNSNLMDIPVPTHPDFSQGEGIVRLLEEMMKREDYAQFSVNHNFIPYDLEFSNHPFIQLCHCKWAIPSDYITIPGKLLDAVWEWFKGRER